MKKYNIKIISLIVVISLIMGIIPVFFMAKAVERDNKDVDIYYKKENDYMKIALTFDDGPHPRYTSQILDLLDEYGIKATFFVVGINAKNYPDSLAEVIKRGHEIGNHTHTHPHVSCLNTGTLTSEVEQCESTIYGLTDYKTKLFRPPEGMIDADVRTVLRSLDYKVIMWDIDTRDWAHEAPQKIAENVVSNIESGDIILMHDYIGHNSPTVEAINLFIPALLEKGYKFVVISELIGLE